MKHLKTQQQLIEASEKLNISDVIDSKINRSRREVIELLSNSSDFDYKDLNKMVNDELVDIWNSLEMDSWLETNINF